MLVKTPHLQPEDNFFILWKGQWIKKPWLVRTWHCFPSDFLCDDLSLMFGLVLVFLSSSSSYSLCSSTNAQILCQSLIDIVNSVRSWITCIPSPLYTFIAQQEKEDENKQTGFFFILECWVKGLRIEMCVIVPMIFLFFFFF